MIYKQSEPLSVFGLDSTVPLMLTLIAATAVFIGCRAAYGQIQTDTDRYLCNLEWDSVQRPPGQYNAAVHKARPVFSDDETLVALVQYGKSRSTFINADVRLLVMDVATCDVLRDIDMQSRYDVVSSIAFSTNGRYIAVDRRNRISVYDLHSASDEVVMDIRYKTQSDFSGYVGQYVQFSADGTRLYLKAESNGRGKIFTFPVDDWENYTSFDANSRGGYRYVTCEYGDLRPPVVHSQDRRYIAIIYRGGGTLSDAPTDYNELHVYDLETNEYVCHTIKVYDLRSVVWSLDGSTILTVGKDEWTTHDYYNITSIDPQTCEVLDIWKWQPERESPGSAIYLDDDHILFTGGHISRFNIFNLRNKVKIESFMLREEGHSIGITNHVSSKRGDISQVHEDITAILDPYFYCFAGTALYPRIPSPLRSFLNNNCTSIQTQPRTMYGSRKADRCRCLTCWDGGCWMNR